MPQKATAFVRSCAERMYLLLGPPVSCNKVAIFAQKDALLDLRKIL
jgi:hypothetical protein